MPQQRLDGSLASTADAPRLRSPYRPRRELRSGVRDECHVEGASVGRDEKIVSVNHRALPFESRADQGGCTRHLAGEVF
jgi:hypothetical protein